ncbi:MAG TPA: hypothetical protein VIQ51_09625 [Chryseosolibacter sp.]|jgi:hypothetical protein
MFVLEVQSDTVRRVTVKEGVRQNSLTEVHGNLDDNDMIVVKGSEELREGTRVAIKQK